MNQQARCHGITTETRAARECPASLDALAGISGVGAKKLQAYGIEILRVLAG